MITWRGLGFLGFMVPLALVAMAAMIWGTNHFTALRIALLVAAVLVWCVGRQLNAAALENGDEVPHQVFGLSLQNSAFVSVVVMVLSLF